jgi:GntP family gluconate:H+ symporter
MSPYIIFTVFLLVLLFMVYGSVKFKLSPFFGLIIASVIVGLIFFSEKNQVFSVIGQGFGRMLANIAFIIIFGALLGELLFKANAFEAISAAVFRGPLKRYPDLALGCIGLIVGIPVFCDSGYLVLRNLKVAIGGSENQKIRNTLMLGAGLYLAHTLVPPTPGPLIIIESLRQTDHLADFILLGFAVSVIVLVLTFLINRYRFKSVNTLRDDITDLTQEVDHPKLPKVYRGLVPLIFPLILIALGSSSKVLGFSNATLQTVSNPAMALFLACLVAIGLNPKLISRVTEISSEALTKVAPVLLLTGAGGAFGAVMAETGFIEHLDIQSGKGIMVLIFVAFGIAALIKSLQGSSTGAIVVTSALLAPILVTYDFGLLENLALYIAIGGGSMIASHTNDSYFWVITKFENYSVKTAINGWTVTSVLLGLSTLTATLIIASLAQ